MSGASRVWACSGCAGRRGRERGEGFRDEKGTGEGGGASGVNRMGLLGCKHAFTTDGEWKGRGNARVPGGRRGPCTLWSCSSCMISGSSV
eukprot:569345-Pleurochrysis_carterae.AAC.2